MNYVFFEKLDDFATIYLDDIPIFSFSIEKHEANLHWVFNQLQKYLLKAEMKKCCLVGKDWNIWDT